MTATDKATPRPLDEAQIDHMVSRFLQWKLPEGFNPDGGISFEAKHSEGTPYEGKYEPSGTNLFDGQQAKAMVLHMVEDLPAALPVPAGAGWNDPLIGLQQTCEASRALLAEAAEGLEPFANAIEPDATTMSGWRFGVPTKHEDFVRARELVTKLKGAS